MKNHVPDVREKGGIDELAMRVTAKPRQKSEFKELLVEAHLPIMRFHDLRHTSVTLVLNEIGAPVREAQHRAGHTSPSTTINIYCGTATSKTDEMVTRRLDELVNPVSLQLHTTAHDGKSLPVRKALT